MYGTMNLKPQDYLPGLALNYLIRGHVEMG